MRKIKKWEIIKEEDVSPSPWFPLFKHIVKLPSGKLIDDYYVSRLGDVAMIVAVTEKKEIVFVRQYKHGVEEVILELPAGRIGNKTPDVAAKVELEEETGLVAKELEYLGFVYGRPSKDSEIVHGFLVTEMVDLKEQKLDVTEEIEVVMVKINKVDEKIKRGEIRATDTITFIKLAQLKAPELFK